MLYALFQSNTEEPIYKWAHYFPVYERHLADFVNKSVLMIEIGVFKGGSLKMWKKYLGPLARVVGLDIHPACAMFDCAEYSVRTGDQADIAFLGRVIKEFGTPDIVLDDGSHMMEDMDASFRFLYPLLNNNGVYIVEDTHTCYRENYGGGLKKPGTFMEKAKELIDRLNAYHIDQNMVDNFTRSTFSISFYDSIVVFEKKAHGRPYAVKSGNPALLEE